MRSRVEVKARTRAPTARADRDMRTQVRWSLKAELLRHDGRDCGKSGRTSAWLSPRSALQKNGRMNRPCFVCQVYEKLELTAKGLREIRDVQRAQSGCGTVAVAAVVEPVVAIFDCVQRRIRPLIAPLAEGETVEREVQQSDPAVQRFAQQGRDAVQLRRDKARAAPVRLDAKDAARFRGVENEVAGIRIGVERDVWNITARIISWQGVDQLPADDPILTGPAVLSAGN